MKLQELKVGDKYQSEPSKNPFERVLRVVVVDIKQGYVKYTCYPGNIEWSLPEDTFRNCYPIKEDNK